MAHIYETHRFVLEEFPWLEDRIVLDLGCGKGDWAYLLRSEKRGDRGIIVGVDISDDYLNFLRKYSPYNLVIKCDLSKSLPFKDKSVDIVFSSELIEHLEKQQSLVLLKEMERVGKGKIILTLPNGRWELGVRTPNVYEMHRSYFTVRELKKLGYKIRGLGFRFFKLYKAKKWHLQKLWALFFYMCTPLSYLFSPLGEFIVAYKDLNG